MSSRTSGNNEWQQLCHHRSSDTFLDDEEFVMTAIALVPQSMPTDHDHVSDESPLRYESLLGDKCPSVQRKI